MIPPVIVRAREQSKTPETPAGASDRRRKARDAAAEARRYVNGVSVAAMVLIDVVGSVIAIAIDRQPATALGILATFLLGLYVLFSIKVARQWERGVVLRFGRFVGLKGPGLFAIVPIVDSLSHLIDQRVRVTDVSAESALTRDTVPVNVDAIVFWTVWDAQKSVLEVSDYMDAVMMSAQTALREAIGRHLLAEMITEREQLGKELQKILDEKTNPWGITVGSVEIRDVKIPPDLEDAMSRQAQAERERQARIILGTAETEIAERFVQAGDAYKDKPLALHLRAMNMLYEAIKEKGSMVIVPSSAVETMGLGGMLATASLGGAKPQ
jgi:regulator of protease activity HflC (stomatin/prohibitin superfamily)